MLSSEKIDERGIAHFYTNPNGQFARNCCPSDLTFWAVDTGGGVRPPPGGESKRQLRSDDSLTTTPAPGKRDKQRQRMVELTTEPPHRLPSEEN